MTQEYLNTCGKPNTTLIIKPAVGNGSRSVGLVALTFHE